ncbi:MAG: TauD/TfdA family dioxygenase [Leptolyngbyaceae cyanobacterium]
MNTTSTFEKQLVPLSDRYLTVAGQRFHYIWLRDHCLCPDCHHGSSFQKIYDVCDSPTLPIAELAYIQDNTLVIHWQDQHQSRFPIPWLLSYAYDNNGNGEVQRTLPQPEPQLSSVPIFWDKAKLETNSPTWPQAKTSTFDTWIKQIDTYGFTIIRNLDWQDLDSFISSIGPVYELAGYGRYSTVKAMPNGQDLSLSFDGDALPPHTDLAFMPAPHIVQLLYCVENQATGGESVLVDGYRVARDFREHHPDYFKVLAETPVHFRQFYQQWDYFVSQSTPIIKLDQTGNITDVYFCHKNFGLATDLTFDQVEQFYEAYRAFSRYVKNPTYQYWFRMEPGDCQILQNFRVLHGRNAFDPNSGIRHLEIAYMEWIYYTGRRDFHRVEPLYLAELTTREHGDC